MVLWEIGRDALPLGRPGAPTPGPRGRVSNGGTDAEGGRYFLEPSKGEWAVTSNGRTVRRYSTKQRALDDDASRAKAAKGQLVIKKADGTIQSERTYGHDPYPPAG